MKNKEIEQYKTRGFIIPNENDGIINGEIIHTDVESIEKGNAQLREQFSSVWITQ